MAQLTLKKINKTYGEVANFHHIIKNVDLEIDNEEFVVFVGPSGCGKSTMLRMIAGLEDISSGELKFDDDIVNELSPSERGVGMVFQSYALYPHMTVRENIAFGLKYTRKEWSKKQKSLAVEDVADILELTELLDRKPSDLSGGQRQRVAIGRALVRQPRVFLLDEPLSNLDAAMRVRMRAKIAQFHQKFKSTIIYVTHDQVEAMTLADKVVVLNKGKIEQVGRPLELYNHPKTEFVAKFIGSPKMNIIKVKLVDADINNTTFMWGETLISTPVTLPNSCKNRELSLGIRPENITLDDQSDIAVIVDSIEFLGAETYLLCHCPKSKQEILIRCGGTVDLVINQEAYIKFSSTAIHVFSDGKSIAFAS